MLLPVLLSEGQTSCYRAAAAVTRISEPAGLGLSPRCLSLGWSAGDSDELAGGSVTSSLPHDSLPLSLLIFPSQTGLLFFSSTLDHIRSHPLFFLPSSHSFLNVPSVTAGWLRSSGSSTGLAPCPAFPDADKLSPATAPHQQNVSLLLIPRPTDLLKTCPPLGNPNNLSWFSVYPCLSCLSQDLLHYTSRRLGSGTTPQSPSSDAVTSCAARMNLSIHVQAPRG